MIFDTIRLNPVTTYSEKLEFSPAYGVLIENSIDTDVDLAAKVAFLQDPSSYPDSPSSVESIETHMAWVFLAGTHAYKMKKPVRFEYLDFSTLLLRRDDCKKEVELNRRLADGVYLGSVPLSVHERRLRIGGEGKVVDWLVQMRRLPSEDMLDARIRSGAYEEEEIRRVARVLSHFYATSKPENISKSSYRSRLFLRIELNETALLSPQYGLSHPVVLWISSFLRHFIEDNPQLFDARIDERRVVEGHGDLRPEHVCLEPKPVIFDCLEFKRSFRIVDPADELAFLAMECEALGAQNVGAWLFDEYSRQRGDHPPAELVCFYKMLRALLRARLAAQHLDDEEVDEAKWMNRASRYLRLALAYLPAN